MIMKKRNKSCFIPSVMKCRDLSICNNNQHWQIILKVCLVFNTCGYLTPTIDYIQWLLFFQIISVVSMVFFFKHNKSLMYGKSNRNNKKTPKAQRYQWRIIWIICKHWTQTSTAPLTSSCRQEPTWCLCQCFIGDTWGDPFVW
jgi:hypothetical protein